MICTLRFGFVMEQYIFLCKVGRFSITLNSISLTKKPSFAFLQQKKLDDNLTVPKYNRHHFTCQKRFCLWGTFLGRSPQRALLLRLWRIIFYLRFVNCYVPTLKFVRLHLNKAKHCSEVVI